MDASQTKALTALQPFIHLTLTTNSPTPRFLADIITRATSAQGTYVFTELLQLEQIQSLRSSPEFKSHLTLLEIFSWGTWEEYQATPNLPPLNEIQTQKLQQMTLLTLASSPTTALTYPFLISSLSLPTAIALESLVTSTIYAGLLTGRLSPTSNPPVVHVTSVAPLRDLRPLSLKHLLKVLEVWEGRCDDVIGELEGQIEAVRTEARKRSARDRGRDEALEAALKEARSENETVKNTTEGQAGNATNTAGSSGGGMATRSKRTGGEHRSGGSGGGGGSGTPWGHGFSGFSNRSAPRDRPGDQHEERRSAGTSGIFSRLRGQQRNKRDLDETSEDDADDDAADDGGMDIDEVAGAETVNATGSGSGSGTGGPDSHGHGNSAATTAGGGSGGGRGGRAAKKRGG